VKIGAIVLAAGNSVRMGTQKLLLPYAGTSVIRHIVEQVAASSVDRVIVVARNDAAAIRVVLEGLPVTVVINKQPDGDMFSSVRCGLRALPPECEAALVVLGDQPSITAGLINQLRDASVASRRGIVIPTYEGRRGHPLLYSLQYGAEVLTRYDDVGLRGLSEAHPADVHEVAVADDGVVTDIDVPDDYQAALRRQHGQDARVTGTVPVTRASRPCEHPDAPLDGPSRV
jgi:molybdenum cofactor cytidylyltransferase